MEYIGYGVVLIIAVYAIRFVLSRLLAAKRGAVPLSFYRAAVKGGRSPEDAIFMSINVLRYRAPWDKLQEADVRRAASVLATLPDPADFCQIVIEVERLKSVDLIHNQELLEAFGRGMHILRQEKR